MLINPTCSAGLTVCIRKAFVFPQSLDPIRQQSDTDTFSAPNEESTPCLTKTNNILKDPSHQHYGLFSLLSSEKLR